jgi:hypothetical protein
MEQGSGTGLKSTNEGPPGTLSGTRIWVLHADVLLSRGPAANPSNPVFQAVSLRDPAVPVVTLRAKKSPHIGLLVDVISTVQLCSSFDSLSQFTTFERVEAAQLNPYSD